MDDVQPETFDPLATVLLHREAGLRSRDDGASAVLVDEVTVWVYADGSTNAFVTRRLVLRNDEIFRERTLDEPRPTRLTDAEAACVLFEAGMERPSPTPPEAPLRWARLDGREVQP
ncbi:MAG: hypothetical protein K0V04_14350 [Deltaproteobacteria bacterium]|nr:hypothetical protein [Deltaproteobacteria bacterium]